MKSIAGSLLSLDSFVKKLRLPADPDLKVTYMEIPSREKGRIIRVSQDRMIRVWFQFANKTLISFFSISVLRLHTNKCSSWKETPSSYQLAWLRIWWEMRTGKRIWKLHKGKTKTYSFLVTSLFHVTFSVLPMFGEDAEFCRFLSKTLNMVSDRELLSRLVKKLVQRRRLTTLHPPSILHNLVCNRWSSPCRLRFTLTLDLFELLFSIFDSLKRARNSFRTEWKTLLPKISRRVMSCDWSYL